MEIIEYMMTSHFNTTFTKKSVAKRKFLIRLKGEKGTSYKCHIREVASSWYIVCPILEVAQSRCSENAEQEQGDNDNPQVHV